MGFFLGSRVFVAFVCSVIVGLITTLDFFILELCSFSGTHDLDFLSLERSVIGVPVSDVGGSEVGAYLPFRRAKSASNATSSPELSCLARTSDSYAYNKHYRNQEIKQLLS